jgi:hypothetical protein
MQSTAIASVISAALALRRRGDLAFRSWTPGLRLAIVIYYRLTINRRGFERVTMSAASSEMCKLFWAKRPRRDREAREALEIVKALVPRLDRLRARLEATDSSTPQDK